MRAFLIVPGGAEALAAAMGCGAAALVVDIGSGAAAAELAGRPADSPLLYLRSADLDRDLPAMMALAPHGIVLSGCEGARDVARLGARLAVEEAIAGRPDGATRILASIGTARGALALPGLAEASPRLAGISWDAEALRAEIGAEPLRDGDGGPIAPLARMPSHVLSPVRAWIRLAAAAAGVEAIDAACRRDGDLLGEIARARRDGFGAKVALDPDQAGIIARSGPPSPPA